MEHSISLDLTRETIWFDLSQNYGKYEMEISNTNGSNVRLKLDENQIKHLAKELLDWNFFEVNDEGDLVIAEI